jgi:hypothetical protein
MARYKVDTSFAGSEQSLAAAGAYKTMIAVTAVTGATTLRRGWIDEITCGIDGLPAATDGQIVYDWSLCTTVGTGTSATPFPAETQDAAALLVYTVNMTIEGTIAAANSKHAIALNQRQSYHWWAMDLSKALVIPAVTVNGIAGRAKSTGTGSYASTIFMSENVTE